MENLVGWIAEGIELGALALDTTKIGISVMVASKVATIEVVISIAGSFYLKLDVSTRSDA